MNNPVSEKTKIRNFYFHLTLIRHGQTEANRKMIVQGIKDGPLNKRGLEQAERTGAYLSHCPINYLFSSVLSRARTTATSILSKRAISAAPIVNSEDLLGSEAQTPLKVQHPLTLHTLPLLNERNVGVFGDGEMRVWLQHKRCNDVQTGGSWRPDGGGESVLDVARRCALFLEFVCARLLRDHDTISVLVDEGGGGNKLLRKCSGGGSGSSGGAASLAVQCPIQFYTNSASSVMGKQNARTCCGGAAVSGGGGGGEKSGQDVTIACPALASTIQHDATQPSRQRRHLNSDSCCVTSGGLCATLFNPDQQQTVQCDEEDNLNYPSVLGLDFSSQHELSPDFNWSSLADCAYLGHALSVSHGAYIVQFFKTMHSLKLLRNLNDEPTTQKNCCINAFTVFLSLNEQEMTSLRAVSETTTVSTTAAASEKTAVDPVVVDGSQLKFTPRNCKIYANVIGQVDHLTKLASKSAFNLDATNLRTPHNMMGASPCSASPVVAASAAQHTVTKQ